MPISPQTQRQVHQAAEAWAQRSGFASAAEVPFAKAGELIREVAAETKIAPDAVRDALLAGASAFQEEASGRFRAFGAEGDYEGPSVHRPLKHQDGGLTPMFALMDARGDQGPRELRGKSGATVDLDTLNAVFHKTSDDFEATRVVITRRASAKTVGELADACGKLLLRFEQLDGSRGDVQVKEEIVRLYDNLMSNVARRKGVFLTKSTPEAPVASFKLEDDSGVRLPDAPRKPHGDSALGLGSSLAVDGATGKTFVLDYHGEVTEVASIAEFVRRREEHFELDQGAAVLAGDPRALDQLRALDDDELARLGGEVEHVSLLEDEQHDLTRVYPTRWHRARSSLLSRRVVCDGPFKGIYLDDLVNELATRRGKGTDVRPARGELPSTPKNGEPFVTTTTIKERGELRPKLYVKVPANREWTQVRRALRRLSELEPAVKYKPGSDNTSFVFGPEHYKLVRDIAGDLILNGPARDMLQGHFDELTRVELAASDKSLDRHTAKAIGGFRASVSGSDGRARSFELTYWQKKSLAWLEARGHKGVIALDTGMGKTMVAIGMMEELRQREGEERKFLVVGPPGLGGNFETEIRKFCAPGEAEALLEKLVVMDYQQFSRAQRSGKLKGKPFRAKDFGAVFFDEAQWIKNRTWVAGRSALAFKHPRKVVLTKSVMKDSVDDAFTLACIANNIDLNDRSEGKEQRYLMRKFRNLYTNVVGGRMVGVKEDVELTPGEFVDPKHNMHAFMKANFLHADKRIDDQKLPRFARKVETLTMPPKLEETYRTQTRRLAKLMRGMVSLYRDEGVSREFVDDKGRHRKVINPLARNRRIAEMFGVKLRGLIGEINTLTNNRQKLDHAAELIWKHLDADPKSRAVLFSDDKDYLLESARRLSDKIPGKLHAACGKKEIRLFQNGKELTRFKGFDLPFKPQAYTGASGRNYGEQSWQKFVLDEVIGAEQEVATATMYGPTYQEGQNLQWADVGVHLDRDTWSRQNTEQREGRLWRKGQKRKVTFYNLDMVYKYPKDDLDRSLDQVRGLYEDVSGQIFHDIIVVPQAMELGEEWEGVRERDHLELDRTVLELAMAPSIKNAAEKGGW